MDKEMKKTISDKIRKYSREQITKDYYKLVEIGGNAKDKSQWVIVGNRIVDYFTFTERLNTIGGKGMSFYELWENRESYMEKNHIKKLIEHEITNTCKKSLENIYYTVFRLYFSSINIFRPLVAMEYYARFNPRCILDPTMGWGGRLVGACALNVSKYIGIDNNPALEEPYGEMVEFLRPLTKTEMDIRFEDALGVDYSVMEYDMVFTSPPYYDLEKYGGNRESKTKDEWDKDFYCPLFEKTYKHLAVGGHYCLNIPESVYERVCFPLLGQPTYILPLKKNNRNQAKKYVENVYVWVKNHSREDDMLTTPA